MMLYAEVQYGMKYPCVVAVYRVVNMSVQYIWQKKYPESTQRNPIPCGFPASVVGLGTRLLLECAAYPGRGQNMQCTMIDRELA